MFDELLAWRDLGDTIVALDALYDGEDVVVGDLARRVRLLQAAAEGE